MRPQTLRRSADPGTVKAVNTGPASTSARGLGHAFVVGTLAWLLLPMLLVGAYAEYRGAIAERIDRQAYLQRVSTNLVQQLDERIGMVRDSLELAAAAAASARCVDEKCQQLWLDASARGIVPHGMLALVTANGKVIRTTDERLHELGLPLAGGQPVDLVLPDGKGPERALLMVRHLLPDSIPLADPAMLVAVQPLSDLYQSIFAASDLLGRQRHHVIGPTNSVLLTVGDNSKLELSALALARIVDSAQDRQVSGRLGQTLYAITAAGPEGLRVLVTSGVLDRTWDWKLDPWFWSLAALPVVAWVMMLRTVLRISGRIHGLATLVAGLDPLRPEQMPLVDSAGSLMREEIALKEAINALLMLLRSAARAIREAAFDRDRANLRLTELLAGQDEMLERQTRELRLAVSAAEAASQTKSALLANTSHEIRTPLNGIIGTVELMLGDALPEHQRRELETVLKLAESLLQLINDILDLSRISGENFSLSAEPTAIGSEIASVVDALAPLARQNGLRLDVVAHAGAAAYYAVDPLRLRQILLNLVGNALKFTEQGGARIEWGVRASGDGIRIVVIDTGIGMSEDQLELIFKPFTQLANEANRRFQGTGLGLSIVKLLVDAMGGEITVESTPGQGSRFTVELPAAAVAAPIVELAGVQIAGPVAHAPLRVLVVDDVEVNRELMRAQLESLDCEVEVAAGGYAALSLLEREPFDLMLLDCQMPDIDGYQTARKVREQCGGRALRIVAVTAGASPSERQRCLDAGMDDYAAKPLRLKVVQQLVAEAQRLKSAEIEL